MPERSTYAKRERRNAQRQREDEIRRMRFPPAPSVEGDVAWTALTLDGTTMLADGANPVPEVGIGAHLAYMRGQADFTVPADTAFGGRATFSIPADCNGGDGWTVSSAVPVFASLVGAGEFPDFTGAVLLILSPGGTSSLRIAWHDDTPSGTLSGDPTVYLDGVTFSLRR